MNHVLIGGRVEWRGKLWIVTGARRDEGSADVAFRLLPLNASPPREEVWTEARPTFGDVWAVRLQASCECSGTLPVSRHLTPGERHKPQNVTISGSDDDH
jgi:hypothetical protein